MQYNNIRKCHLSGYLSSLAAAIILACGFFAAPAQAAVKAKKLTVKTKKIVLYKGAAAGYGSKQLKVTVKPKKAKVTYKINKKKVASVSKKGLVKAKKPGNAKITIKSGSKKVVVKVVVKKIKKKVTKVTATKNITVNVGAKQKIKTSVKPKKATLKALAFTSNAKKIAKVNAKGVITGIKAGNAKITVKAVDGSKKKATVAVLVTGAAIASNPAITTGPSVTTAPTVAPTATVAPTTVPTVVPTEAPTTAPTEAPTTAPTEAPTEAPVETIAPVVKDNGDLSYDLPALAEGSSYKVSFGEGNNAEITAGAVAAIETIRDRFEASAQKDAVKAAESFVSKAYDNKAFGGFVVNKEAGKDTAVVSYNGKDYNLTVKADGDVAKVAVEGEFSLTVKGANGSYTVSDLKVGSVEGNGAYAATVAVAEDGTVTATITGAAGACTVTVQNGNVTLDIAKAVQEKYGFVISK